MVRKFQVTVVRKKSLLSRASGRAGVGDLEWHFQEGLIGWSQQSHCQLAKYCFANYGWEVSLNWA